MLKIIHVNIKLIKHYFLKYLREKRQDTYWPIVTVISRIFLLVGRHYIYSFKESGNLPNENIQKEIHFL